MLEFRARVEPEFRRDSIRLFRWLLVNIKVIRRRERIGKQSFGDGFAANFTCIDRFAEGVRQRQGNGSGLRKLHEKQHGADSEQSY